MNILVLRWKSPDGKTHKREYKVSQHSEVERASRWLANNGAVGIDVAMKIAKPKEDSDGQTI